MSKSGELLFEYEADCLKVKAATRHILFQKEAIIKSLAAAIAAHPVKTVLVDLRTVPGPFTFTDRVQLGELAGIHLTGIPIAVLLLEEQADHERIGKMVARNRAANVNVFTNLAEAEAWLKKYLSPVK